MHLWTGRLDVNNQFHFVIVCLIIVDAVVIVIGVVVGGGGGGSGDVLCHHLAAADLGHSPDDAVIVIFVGCGAVCATTAPAGKVKTV